jgi:hypothetical protein
MLMHLHSMLLLLLDCFQQACRHCLTTVQAHLV